MQPASENGNWIYGPGPCVFWPHICKYVYTHLSEREDELGVVWSKINEVCLIAFALSHAFKHNLGSTVMEGCAP